MGRPRLSDPNDEMLLPATPKSTSFLRMPVKSAFLHQTLTWPGVCGSEKTLTKNKIKDIEMFWCPHGLEIHSKNQICIVPHANVANAILVRMADAEE